MITFTKEQLSEYAEKEKVPLGKYEYVVEASELTSRGEAEVKTTATSKVVNIRFELYFRSFNMKKFIAFLVVLTAMIPEIIYAQNYYVTDIIEVQNDLTARTNPRKDPSGNDCALLKINVPSVKRITFEGSIGDVKYLPGEFDVYIAEGTKSIEYLIHDSGKKAIIDFAQYGIEIIGKTVYKVILQAQNTSAAAYGALAITANQPGAIVLIDGIPSGQTPVTVNGLSAGEHIISIPNTIGYSCADTKVLVKSGEITNVFLPLTEKVYQGIGIEWAKPGGDSAGWYQVRTKTIKNNGKVGLADFTGRVLVPCEFDYVYPDLQSGFYVVTLNDKDGLYKPGVGLVVDCIYDSITTSDVISKWHRAKKGRTYGYINREGVEIVPFIFTYGTWYSTEENSSMIIASVDGGAYEDITGVFDASGNVIVEPRSAIQHDYHEGVSVGRYKDGKSSTYFIMDVHGNETLLPGVTYIDEWEFHNGLLPVRNSEKKWGCINTNGALVIPYKYEEIEMFYGNCARICIKNDSIYSFINKEGSVITPNLEYTGKMRYNFKVIGDSTTYEWLPTSDKTDCYFKIGKNGKYGLMNSRGSLSLPIQFDSIDVHPFYFKDIDCIEAFKDGENYIFDRNLRFLFSIPDNLSVCRYEDGILQIIDKESDTYGFLNEKGDVLGACIYSRKCPSDDKKICSDYKSVSGSISEGMAMLVIGDHFGFMDKTGNVVVPAIYTAALPYKDGFAFVRRQDGSWLKIDKSNNIH